MLKVFCIVTDIMSVLLMGSRMDILYYFVQVVDNNIYGLCCIMHWSKHYIVGAR